MKYLKGQGHVKDSNIYLWCMWALLASSHVLKIFLLLLDKNIPLWRDAVAQQMEVRKTSLFSMLLGIYYLSTICKTLCLFIDSCQTVFLL